MISAQSITIPDPDGRMSGIPHHTAEPDRYHLTFWDKHGRVIGKPFRFPAGDDLWFKWNRPRRVRRFEVRVERGPFTCPYLADPGRDRTWSCAHCGQRGEAQR